MRFVRVLVTLISMSLPLWCERGVLKVRIVDDEEKSPTPARVNVIGSDHAYYEPDRNPLAAYSLKNTGNRGNVGPLRYTGSFFYTPGEFELSLPAGVAQVEVTKGYAYYRATATPVIRAGKTTELRVEMRRMIDLAKAGWRTADAHVHLPRMDDDADRVITQLLSAEGIGLGYIMTRDSVRGFGRQSTASGNGVAIASGFEITTPQLGHVNIVMPNRELEPATPIALLFNMTAMAGGALQHDHGGYGQEIYSDVVYGKSDWVELLQFGSYRAKIGLDGYYLMLNSGFRYPLAGGSDYPVCRTLSDSMTFLPLRENDLSAGVGRMIRGQSFASSGPLVFLTVNGKGPGSDLTFPAGATQMLDVQVTAASADLPLTSLEVIQDGAVVAEWHDAAPVYQKSLRYRAKASASSWIAARCSGPGTAFAHTNPVWIYLGDAAPFKREAAAEFAKRVAAFSPANVDARTQQYLDLAKKRAAEIAAGSPPTRPQIPPARFPVTAVSSDMTPGIRSRPSAKSVTLSGVAVNTAGQPITGATISITGDSATAATDSAGRFTLKTNASAAVSLRAAKSDYITTNTTYLNPNVLGSKFKITLFTAAELGMAIKKQSLAKNEAALIVSVADEAGKPATTVKLTTSPEPRLGAQKPPSADFQSITGVNGIQYAGVTRIALQENFPPVAEPYEANLIITAPDLKKSVTMPAYPGQITYAVLMDDRSR